MPVFQSAYAEASHNHRGSASRAGFLYRTTPEFFINRRQYAPPTRNNLFPVVGIGTSPAHLSYSLPGSPLRGHHSFSSARAGSALIHALPSGVDSGSLDIPRSVPSSNQAVMSIMAVGVVNLSRAAVSAASRVG